MNQNHGLSGHKLSFPHKIRTFSVYEISNWISRKFYRNFTQVHRCFLAVTWPPFFVPLLDGIRTTDSVSRGKFFVPCAKGSEKKGCHVPRLSPRSRVAATKVNIPYSLTTISSLLRSQEEFWSSSPDTVTPFTEVGRRGGASIPPQTSGRDGSVGRRGPSTEGSAGSGLWGLGRGRLDVKGRWRTETSKESGKKGVSEKGNKQ